MEISRAVGEANKIIAETVHETTKQGHFCLLLGGDHRYSFYIYAFLFLSVVVLELGVWLVCLKVVLILV